MPGNVPIEVSGIGNLPVVAGVSGKRIRVWSYVLVGEDGPTTTVKWRSLLSGAPIDLTGAMPINGRTIPVPAGSSPYFETDIGADLVLAATDSVLISGHVFVSLIG